MKDSRAGAVEFLKGESVISCFCPELVHLALYVFQQSVQKTFPGAGVVLPKGTDLERSSGDRGMNSSHDYIVKSKCES